MIRIIHAIFLGVLSSAAAQGTHKKDSRPPNVLMICIDDLNDWVGFLGGHPDVKTPHMDRPL
ncbi:MAG: hypothetical protein ACJAVK_003230 [Akkermansiaceae bacterium]|jgi:hypothetical protein